MLSFLGWLLILGGAISGFIAHDSDRRLQAFRVSTGPKSRYWFTPLRIRRELYRPEGGHLVDRAWRAIGAMYGLAFVGVVLLAIAYRGR
jgi:hypothetical protein